MLKFYKYQGAGNDFILIDNRKSVFEKDVAVIGRLCDRRFGIGADGLILLENPKKTGDDFTMTYFNADGQESSMCGNGGRCIARFAQFLGIIKNQAVFSAIDGKHQAKIEADTVHLKMGNVETIEKDGEAFRIDSGSPHYITFVKNVDAVNVKEEGKKIRNSSTYKQEGINVNFVEIGKPISKIRTYERGVEDETLACGTGVTASALAIALVEKSTKNTICLQTRGGKLCVSFQKDKNRFSDIWLTGPAEKVFEGEIQ